MVTLKIVELPETIYITGLWIETETPAFNTTDDYCSVAVAGEYIETGGSVYIYTEPQWQHHLQLLKEDEIPHDERYQNDIDLCDEYLEYFKIHNVEGKISVIVTTMDDEADLLPDTVDDIENAYLHRIVKYRGGKETKILIDNYTEIEQLSYTNLLKNN